MSQASDDRPNQEAGETQPPEQPVLPAAPPEGSRAPTAAPAIDKPRRRRRRRRKGKRPADGTAPPNAESQTGEKSAGEPAQAAEPSRAAMAPPPDRGPRRHGPGERRFLPRRPRPASAGAPSQGAGEQGPRERLFGERRFRGQRRRPEAPAEAGAAPQVAQREERPRGERRHGERPRGAKKGRFNDRRESRREKPEPKLYSLESVVDRGFEDVADAANEGAIRRVNWTILKRTIADQRSAKPISAVYLLRRDGVDTEFANLSAARLAVHKTIVHPEKLTRAKADYAVSKK